MLKDSLSVLQYCAGSSSQCYLVRSLTKVALRNVEQQGLYEEMVVDFAMNVGATKEIDVFNQTGSDDEGEFRDCLPQHPAEEGTVVT